MSSEKRAKIARYVIIAMYIVIITLSLIALIASIVVTKNTTMSFVAAAIFAMTICALIAIT